MTDSVVCTAKGGVENCRYHKHVFAMYSFQAQIARGGADAMEAMEGYYQERQVVEQMMREGWVENSMANETADPYAQVEKMRAGVLTPMRRAQRSGQQAPEPTVGPVGGSGASDAVQTGQAAVRPTRNPNPRETVAANSNPTAPENQLVVKMGPKQITFYRARPGVLAAEPSYIRIATERPLSDEDMRLLQRHISYAYKTTINSKQGDENKLGRAYKDSTNSMVLPANMSLTNRPNLAQAVQSFQKQLSTQLVKGTGGPKGIPALENAPAFALYYDSVTIDVPESASSVG